ncbi:MAG: hypothetical protein QXY83_05375, partial [Thermosphaera sp.]
NSLKTLMSLPVLQTSSHIAEDIKSECGICKIGVIPSPLRYFNTSNVFFPLHHGEGLDNL